MSAISVPLMDGASAEDARTVEGDTNAPPPLRRKWSPEAGHAPESAQSLVMSWRQGGQRAEWGSGCEYAEATEDNRRKSRAFESLDYNQTHSDMTALHHLRMPHEEHKALGRAYWLTYAAIGVGVGLIAFLVDLVVRRLQSLRFHTTRAVIHTSGNFAGWAVYTGFALAYAGISTALVLLIEPVAAGSGIPETKGFLNGTNVPHFLTPRALLVKMVGVCFSVSAGLFIGKEGPLIHIGAALGNLVSSLPGLGHFALFRDSPWLYRFRTDRHKRDFVSAGAAAGVAGAFSSPTGGIAFALEEASTFWSNKLTWSTFFATMLCTSTLWVLTAISKGEASFWGLVKFGAFSFESSFVIWEIPLMVLPLGIAGGIIGALFNHLSWCLAQWRQVNVPARNRGRRALEVLAVVFVTATLTYSMPLMAKTCQARVPNYQCDNHQNKYYCGTSSLQDVSNDLDVNPVGQNCDYNCTDASYYVSLQCGEENFNAMATLTFESNDNVIKAMFHDKASIAPGILLLYFIVAFVLAVWTYGMAVPSGLFVPCILMGGAVGRMWGELLKLSLPEAVGGQINPGIYAVIGAAAVLSGVTRITITLTIILFETTNQLYLITPVMFTVILAKWVGDAFNISVYDIHMALKCMPFVEATPPRGLDGLTAGNFMMAPVRTVYDIEEMGHVADLLSSCHHNAFPVVSHEAPHPFLGMVRRNEVVAMIRHRHWKGSRAEALLHPYTPATLMSPADFATSLQSRSMDLDDSRSLAALAEAPRGAVLDFRPYMDRGTITVTRECPVSRCSEIFRSFGTRHLPVLNYHHVVEGIITRKELMSEFQENLC